MRLVSFNGAATFQSRKLPPAKNADDTEVQLQWGRDLSVAETTVLERLPRPMFRLQWGRDLSVAETSGSYELPTRGANASMGPRPFSRGNVRDSPRASNALPALQWGRDLSVAETQAGDRRGPRRPARASMGPRPFSRGNSVAPSGSSCSMVLQWGRDLSVAETAVVGGKLYVFDRLQWGRDLSVAETRTKGLSVSRTVPCFNGAATFQSRKPGRRSR